MLAKLSSRCCAVRLFKNELPLQRGACIYARLLKTNVCDAPGPSGRARRGSKPMPCRVQTHVHLISLRQGARRGLPGGRHRALACAAWPFLNKTALSPRRRAHFAFKLALSPCLRANVGWDMTENGRNLNNNLLTEKQ